MKKQTYVITLLFLLFLSTTVFAQQDPQFSQYLFNKMYLTPAVAGIDPEFGEATLIHRSQWLGYNPTFNDGVAPTTQAFSIAMPFPRKESFEGNPWGWGINAVNDQYGAFGSQEAHLSLAHHIKLKKGLLSIGIRGGIYNQTINFDKYRWVDETDPLNVNGRRSAMTLDFGAGLYYSTGKYFMGLSANRLRRASFNYSLPADNIDVQGFTKQAMHANLILGYNLDAGSSWVVTPSALLKYSEKTNFSFELNTTATYNDKHFIGVGYREGDAAIMMVGTHLMAQKQMRIGYAFDLIVQGKNAKSFSSHEIRLTYRIPPMIVRVPSIIRTPRFKHF